MRNFKSSIGSTNGTTSQFLVDDDTEATEPSTNDDFLVYSTDMLDDLYAKATKGKIYIYDIMVRVAHASRLKGIEASHLSKIWIIELDSSKQTLEVTSQNSTRSDNPTISCNFETNNHMLQYKRTKEHFFMGTFFSTNTAGKYSQGNTCCELFVIYKGFFYIVSMKIKSEVLQEVKQCSK